MSVCSVMRINDDDKYAFKDFSFVKDLNLKAMFDFRRGAKFGEAEVRLEDYFTTDINVIRLRQEMFAELVGNPALYERLKNSFSALYELFELQKVKSEAVSTEVLLFGTLELETYVAYLDDVRDIFTNFDVKSELLQSLWEAVKPLCTGEEYGALKKKISEHAYTVKNIRSITIGINLDPQLRPLEAGVVSVNDRSFVSGNLLDRILRLDLKKDGYTCISPFYPMNRKLSDEEFTLMKVSVSSAINKVFTSAVGSWSNTVKNFVISSLRELAPVVSEWRAVSACTDALLKLKQKGYPLCRAEFGGADKITGLYHPVLALLHSGTEGKRVVKNGLDFDGDAGIYILTGPNQGGKSIFTQAAGILYAMLHLGLLLPADSAVVRPVDNILTHFTDDGHISYDHGRLSAECDRIYKINRIISENSLFLFDEALSSTNPAEAVAISSEIIRAYAEIGARGIWTTHFYELHGLTEDPDNKSKVCSLTAMIDKQSHERQFKIVRGGVIENSYAKDLAKKYNLSKNEIIKCAFEKTGN